MKVAVEKLLELMSKDQINEGLDALALSYMLGEDNPIEEKRLVYATVSSLKSFLKSI